MRILEVSNFFHPKTSGSGRYCFELSRRLASAHEVTVLTSRIPRDAPAREEIDGVNVERIHAWGEGWNISALSFIIPRLRKIVGRYDFVHLHSYLFLMSNQVGLYRKVREFPLYLHLHGGLVIPEIGGFKPFFKKHLYDPFVGKFMFNAADRIMSISKADIEILRNGFDVRKEVHWVPNGIDTSQFPYARKGKNKRITYIGRLEKWKGVLSLPRMVAEVHEKDREVSWRIVGEGTLRERLQRECQTLPVTFTGDVPHSQIPSLLADTDILVLPSLVEGVPTVALEALSCGCPVVARNVGSVSEIVDSDCGILLENDGEFSEKISTLLDDPSLIAAMGEAGRRKVELYYDWKPVVARCEAVMSL
jgi:glycosyltransferase involved in cell wall biosynthesis